MNKKLELTQEQIQDISNKVMKLELDKSGIEIMQTGKVLHITKGGMAYILSEEELTALKIYLNVLSLTFETIKDAKTEEDTTG